MDDFVEFEGGEGKMFLMGLGLDGGMPVLVPHL